MTLSNEGVSFKGDLALPGGLGSLAASGSIEVDGDVDMALSGSLSPVGFEIADVSGTISSFGGVKVTAKMQVPILSDALVMSGTIRDNDDWEFIGEAQITMPLGDGTKLAGLKATLTQDGLKLAGGKVTLTMSCATGAAPSDCVIGIKANSINGCFEGFCVGGNASANFNGSDFNVEFKGSGFEASINSSGCIKIKAEVKVKTLPICLS
ncbi:MAG: hypothetical protein ACI9OJ_000381 [Myxococcota bacterium]|jgi:hypothetical protein